MEIPPNLGSRYTQLFRSSFAHVAQATSARATPFILDGIATNSELMQADGIHPTAKSSGKNCGKRLASPVAVIGGILVEKRAQSARQKRLEAIIFGTGTRAGRTFDLLLLFTIVTSVAVVIIDSLAGVHARLGKTLYLVELSFTLLFTVEYVVRIWCVRHRRAYIFSFWG